MTYLVSSEVLKNAGVHSLLMSLKPVYDESTANRMIAFYQGLAQDKTKQNGNLFLMLKIT